MTTKRTIDENGWMTVADNPITRVGVFDYLGSEIGAPIPDKIYRVYRPAEELMKDECLNSFKLLPFIDEHMALGAKGVPAEDKGIQGCIGEQVYFDAPYVRGNIKVMSNAALATIGGGKIELSPGYDCRYEFTPGAFDGEAYDAIQRDIRGNHLALVDEGRTGPDVAVQDARPKQLNAKQLITIDTKRLIRMEFTPEQLEQIRAIVAQIMADLNTGDANPDKTTEDAEADKDKLAADAVDPETGEVIVTAAEGDAAELAAEAATEAEEVIAEAGAAIEEVAVAVAEVAAASEEVIAAADSKAKKLAMDKLTVAKGKLAKAQGARKRLTADSGNRKLLSAVDALTKQVAELKKAKAPVAMDTGALLKQLGERDALAERVSHFIGTFDHKSMTLDAVAKYAVDKVGLKVASGQERTALDAWLHGRQPETQRIITGDSKTVTSLIDMQKKQGE